MKFIKRILLPQPIETEAIQLLEKSGFEIILAPNVKPETLFPLMKDIQGIILRTGIQITRELLTYADDLWIISRTGAGVDNVDVEAATEKGILVTVVPGVNTSTVVEHTLALMFALMKRLLILDQAVRNDNFNIRYQNLPQDLREKTLGIVGLGRIGSELARICKQSFQMHILGYDPYLTPEIKTQLEKWVEFCEMEKLFRESDIISLHIPLLPHTRKFIGMREFSLMKSSAFLINTSRGGVLDEEALIQCLKEKKIAGAALDVFAQEPLEKENPLKKLTNVILTPHVAALTKECVIRLAVHAVEAILDLSQGKKPNGVVNPEVFLHPRWKEWRWN